MLESSFFYAILPKMIPWKFHKDWLNTDLENWFENFGKIQIFEKVKKNLAQMEQVTIFFGIFWTLGS